MAIFKRNDQIYNPIFSRNSQQNITEEPVKEEGLGAIMSDIFGLPGKAINYALSVPEKTGESYQQIKEKPGRAFLNLPIGLGEGIKSTLNLPHEGLKYLGEKNVIPEWLKKYNELPFTHLPENIGVEDAIGMGSNEPGDELLRLLPQLLVGNRLSRPLKAEIPANRRWASMHLNRTRELANPPGVGPLNIPEHLMQEARRFFPENMPTDNLFQEAASGRYDPLFTVQSDLGDIGRELAKSSTGADRLLARQINGPRGRPEAGLRHRFLDAMRGELSAQDLHEAADLMRRGQGKYRQYMRYVHPISSKVPGMIANGLGYGALYKLFKGIGG